jgi:hypothetical protein
MNTRYERLLEIIASSINAIGEEYFNFQVAGNDGPIKRERVYCAELYHQMRMRFEPLPYDLNVEPDKTKHAMIEQFCGAVDPDFIVHRSGNMGREDNLAVIEVKTSDGNITAGIVKDLKTINCMTSIPNGYYGGVIIVFGELTKIIKRNLIKRITEHKLKEMLRLTLFLQLHPETLPEKIEI